MPEVAAAHAEALDVQIHALRLRRAVLRAAAKRGSGPQEMELMHKLVKLSEVERRRIIHQFIDQAFGDLDAWVELAELVQDPDFKASVRRAAEYQAAERVDGDRSGLHHELTNQIRQWVEAALAGGIDPASEQARLVLADLVGGLRPSLRQGRHPRLPQQAADPTADRQRPTGRAVLTRSTTAGVVVVRCPGRIQQGTDLLIGRLRKVAVGLPDGHK